MDGIKLTETSEDNELRWFHYLTHGGFFLFHAVKCFFSKPFKPAKKELDLMENVSSLLGGRTTSDNIEKVKSLIYLHRVIEKTKARRRLEKWSLRVIAIYLIVVFLLVVASYISVPELNVRLIIPEHVMIAILTTTTVNIIGLGLIVLRGHFLANEMTKEDDGK